MKQIIDGEFIAFLEGHDLVRHEPMDGLFGGNRKSPSYGSSAEFAEHRDYTPGDDLRRIDWNLYARLDKLFTKLYIDEKQQQHRIYIDASASMDWGKPSKAEAALKLAAALGYLAVGGLDKVSYYTVRKDTISRIGSRIGTREGFYGVAEELNAVRFGGDTDFGRAFTSLEDTGGHDGVSVIISDFLTESDYRAAADYLLYHGREVWFIQVLSPDELAPGMHGKMLLLDSESVNEDDYRNYKLDITKASLKAYSEAFKWHRQELKNYCAGRGIRFMTVCTDTPVEEMLFVHAAGAEMII